jgi:hypothetical protein
VTILLEEPDKEKCSDTLVPIRKGMILDNKIEKVCCLFFDRWIEIDSVECRDNTGENPDEALILLIPEDIVGFRLFEELGLQLYDSTLRLSVVDDVGDILISCTRETPCVILIQCDK